ncbi:hypothetical protein ACLB2K_045434 [Fragaria x ananassa]
MWRGVLVFYKHASVLLEELLGGGIKRISDTSCWLVLYILHNMIVEGERSEDSDEDLESDEGEDNNMRQKIAEVWDGPTGQDFEEVGRDAHTFEGFMERYNEIWNQYNHSNL